VSPAPWRPIFPARSQGNYSRDTAEDNPDGKDYKLSEERAQLKLESSLTDFRLFIKGDAFHDNIDKHSIVELREGYIDYTSQKWDASGRAGRHLGRRRPAVHQ
jgi:hypothetical protein